MRALVVLAMALVMCVLSPGSGMPQSSAAPPRAVGVTMSDDPSVTTANRGFKVRSFRTDEGGSSIAKGTVKFIGRNVVNVVFRVNDICPDDGSLGWLKLVARLKSGATREVNFADKGGCTTATYSDKYLFTPKRYITKITVKSCVGTLATEPTSPIYFVNRCRSKSIDNPKVR